MRVSLNVRMNIPCAFSQKLTVVRYVGHNATYGTDMTLDHFYYVCMLPLITDSTLFDVLSLCDCIVSLLEGGSPLYLAASHTEGDCIILESVLGHPTWWRYS
jgi:hypothetical protein